MSDLKKAVFYSSTNPDALTEIISGLQSDIGDFKLANLDALTEIVSGLQSAMLGDFKLAITPTALTPEPTDVAWSETIEVALTDTAGVVHTWYTKDVATGVSVADDSVAGSATLDSTTLSFNKGVAKVVVSGDAKDWLDKEVVTVTVGNISVNGITATGGNVTITFTEVVTP